MVNYTLHYFDCYGRAEPIRMMFALADIPYTDRRFAFEDWSGLKNTPLFMFGESPVLEIDGKILPQSLAITRYIANKYGFAGKTDWERAQVDSFIDFHYEFFHKIRPFYGVACKYWEGDFDELLKTNYLPERDNFFKKFTHFLEENETKSGFLVGDSLTSADLILLNHIFIFQNWVPDLTTNFPKITEHCKQMKEIPKMVEYLAKRPHSIQ